MTWQQGLRGGFTPGGWQRASSANNTPLRAGPAPGGCQRASSANATPQRDDSKKKRRSLSHWWAESSSVPPKGKSSSGLSTPGGAAMTPDVEDNISENSVQSVSHTNPVLVLNGMSRRSKRLSVERKRRQLDELTRGQQIYSESSTPLPSCPPMVTTDLGHQCTGAQSWLGSLRRGRSCPPPANTLTLGCEPHLHTAHRVRDRSERSTEHCSVMSESVNLQPREHAALEKHLERAGARSLSAQRSVSATPELSTRSASARRQVRTPHQHPLSTREHAAIERHVHRATARSRSSQRQSSETPERDVCPSSKRQPLQSLERVAFGRHVERVARSHSAQRTASGTRGEQHSGACPFTPRERTALEKHLERLATSSAQHSGTTTPERQTRSGCRTPDENSVQVASNLSAPCQADSDEQWVRRAANPEERAERARTITQAKFERSRADDRARVFVFKRGLKPSATHSSARTAAPLTAQKS